jgi:hypothetical protein
MSLIRTAALCAIAATVTAGCQTASTHTAFSPADRFRDYSRRKSRYSVSIPTKGATSRHEIAFALSC